MGEKKDHFRKLSELSEKIVTLSESIRQAEKDMTLVWTDEIEMRDLQKVKERMKAVEETLGNLQEEVEHIESSHCKKA